mgnify:CR=1 FL=1
MYGPIRRGPPAEAELEPAAEDEDEDDEDEDEEEDESVTSPEHGAAHAPTPPPAGRRR